MKLLAKQSFANNLVETLTPYFIIKKNNGVTFLVVFPTYQCLPQIESIKICVNWHLNN
jgi:hypothetical protein